MNSILLRVFPDSRNRFFHVLFILKHAVVGRHMAQAGTPCAEAKALKAVVPGSIPSLGLFAAPQLFLSSFPYIVEYLLRKHTVAFILVSLSKNLFAPMIPTDHTVCPKCSTFLRLHIICLISCNYQHL